MTDLKPLILNLAHDQWRQIYIGDKGHEYRLVTPYWIKRIAGKEFSFVELRSGYPKKTDHSKIIRREWRGCFQMNFIHPFFGCNPVDVFAIDVSKQFVDPGGF